MPDAEARTNEVRDLEAKLEQHLLLLDHAEAQGVKVFKIAAIVASIQQRLDYLRGTEVAANHGRRAAFFTHLVKTTTTAPPDRDRQDQGPYS